MLNIGRGVPAGWPGRPAIGRDREVGAMSTESGHLDRFAADNLPPADQWPDFLLDRPEYRYPERLNCAVTFLDDRVAAGDGDRPCLLAPGFAWTYAETAGWVNRIAHVLVNRHGLVPGNRVLLRAPNNPW